MPIASAAFARRVAGPSTRPGLGGRGELRAPGEVVVDRSQLPQD